MYYREIMPWRPEATDRRKPFTARQLQNHFITKIMGLTHNPARTDAVIKPLAKKRIAISLDLVAVNVDFPSAAKAT